MNRTSICLTAALLCESAVAARTITTIRGWEVEKSKDECSATKDYVDGTSLQLAVNLDGEHGNIVLWNDDWKSIRRNGRYNITLRFDNGKRRLYRGGGMRTAYSGGIMIGFNDIDVFKLAYGAQRLYVWNGSKQVGSYSLSGSASALEAVEKCLRPKGRGDPFS